MRKSLATLVTAGLLTSVMLTACDDGGEDGAAGNVATTSGGSEKVTGNDGIAVILPDTKTSQRWSTDDPKYLEAAFKKANVPYQIFNAEGDKNEFQRIAETALDKGFKVLMIVSLDSVSGKAVIQKAHDRKVPVIDYDRLTLNGGADYYVSFDNQEVGRLQAKELESCLKAKEVEKPVIAELNGSPTDNNATLFKEGYDAYLSTMFNSGRAVQGPDQFVPEWDNDTGREIFALMLKQFPNINGVLAANDGLGNAAIEVLREKGLAGKVQVTGQDATTQGLQNILAGEQCMTVYKDVKSEADAAADLAINLYQNKKPQLKDKLKDPESGAYIQFRKLAPKAITIKNVKSVVEAGFVDPAALCTAKYRKACRTAGIIK
ncbi:sugar ABC transporter substrate-binding protein [Actinoplanes utahensis]|uniref:Sugar ABC transporter substrate-binding protein n=1 Tax=Actinoplanes utahensis TaxID=1869 RepID=A0A0A6UTV4_ACTUT|nr:substrate-binding domain-containing protein [Actinoplanes utahensis]KHD78786.1 sugar ABC transporter substrate-binding protein [Actinoplanes utahensis]GIF32156.1 sugar ABC transporter substrate-binding protein [Actinoplanes utahensis]